jgi:hypothetical protein
MVLTMDGDHPVSDCNAAGHSGVGHTTGHWMGRENKDGSVPMLCGNMLR